jgi:sucrose-6-phosphate hydrolase SacC (GH32 family)
LYCLCVVAAGPTVARAAAYQEEFRPQIHFTPATNWMGAPSALVWHEDEYHLFYPMNPKGAEPGATVLAHAVSEDLVDWQHLPPAVRADESRMALTGGGLNDERNSSGFGRGNNPPLVLIYSAHDPTNGTQTVHLSYSTDRGRSWIRHRPDPVFNSGQGEFRDPRVFWHEGGRRWVMVAALPFERKVRFYASADLKRWNYLSEFGPAGSTLSIWESPDLFSLRVRKGRDTIEKWVLLVNVRSGAPSGGSGTQYFVGGFDGTRFVPDPRFPRAEPEFVPVPTLLVDFDQDYRRWTVTGDAFGTAPARVKEYRHLNGPRGEGFVHTGIPGNPARGTLTSPEFPMDDDYLSFLIGGGNYPGRTCFNLLVDGAVVRTATGDNTEALSWKSWDIRPFRGKRAKLQIVDEEAGEWGHILLDHVVFSDLPARPGWEPTLWFDYGPDFSGTTVLTDTRKREPRVISAGWLNNWRYAERIPTRPWRGMLSLPRELTLRETSTGFRVAQEPVEEVRRLRDRKHRLGKASVAQVNEWLGRRQLAGRLWELELLVESPNPTSEFGLNFFESTNQITVLRCNLRLSTITLDRSQSGRSEFHSAFADVYNAPLPLAPEGLRLRIFLDASSIEVFAGDGQTALSALLFPGRSRKPFEFWALDKALVIWEVNLYELEPVVPIETQVPQVRR